MGSGKKKVLLGQTDEQVLAANAPRAQNGSLKPLPATLDELVKVLQPACRYYDVLTNATAMPLFRRLLLDSFRTSSPEGVARNQWDRFNKALEAHGIAGLQPQDYTKYKAKASFSLLFRLSSPTCCTSPRSKL